MANHSCTAKLAQKILHRITRSLSRLDGLLLHSYLTKRDVSCLCGAVQWFLCDFQLASVYREPNKTRECTYNIILRHVCITVVTVSSKYYIFKVCVCSFSNPACKAHAQYYVVICGLTASTIFFHIKSNGKFSGKKLLNIQCVF